MSNIGEEEDFAQRLLLAEDDYRPPLFNASDVAIYLIAIASVALVVLGVF